MCTPSPCKCGQWYDAASANVAAVFRQSGAPELTLITCGGPFDRQARQYLQRYVIRAVKVAGTGG